MINIDIGIGVRQEILDLIITETKHSQYSDIGQDLSKRENDTTNVMETVFTKGSSILDILSQTPNTPLNLILKIMYGRIEDVTDSEFLNNWPYVFSFIILSMCNTNTESLSFNTKFLDEYVYGLGSALFRYQFI